jgi:hypothetical protein
MKKLSEQMPHRVTKLPRKNDERPWRIDPPAG